ncbi:hypothetical protein K504DRAFT_9841 [Pleomassaria siparia CBS 279.74]|uniref:Uncharacterized protein n=1 Tax=Pleomassaria siparia CBS 279.74 TaxID=1314801 RepID=A0A6G1KQD3_9PLEO|nr:hypothetical protein K504DRAFT_9841 [Pleomassaria siparia CBS 279.74]
MSPPSINAPLVGSFLQMGLGFGPILRHHVPLNLITPRRELTRALAPSTLAMILSLSTLTSHMVILLATLLHISRSASSPLSNSTYHFAAYNLIAGGASLIGLIGAIRINPNLVCFYTHFHKTTLIIITFVLLELFLPAFSILPDTFAPLLGTYEMDAHHFCKEMDGFRDDEEWILRCSTQLAMVKGGVGCLVGLALAAQWWAVFDVWMWSRELRRNGGGKAALKVSHVEEAGASDPGKMAET